LSFNVENQHIHPYIAVKKLAIIARAFPHSQSNIYQEEEPSSHAPIAVQVKDGREQRVLDEVRSAVGAMEEKIVLEIHTYIHTYIHSFNVPPNMGFSVFQK